MSLRRLAVGICLFAAVPLLPLVPRVQAEEGQIPESDQCAACHLEMDDEAVDVTRFYSIDVHARAGLSCVDCHGGDPSSDDEDLAMDEAAGFRGAPGPLEIPDFCARCHSDPSYMRRFNPGLPVDQLTQYRTSGHGRAHQQGDAKVAQCVSCHGAHEIRPANEPKSSIHPQNVATTCGRCHSDETLMKEYGLPTDQVTLYEDSVHGVQLIERRDFSSPTCNDCHGNHGASPPEVESVTSVCGSCHLHNRELFTASVKYEVFQDLGEHGCVTCHGNHGIGPADDSDLDVVGDAICAECHDDDDSEASLVIVAMRSSLDSLRTSLQLGATLLEAAEQKGLYVLETEYKWRDARQQLLQARTAVHRFDVPFLNEVTTEGMKLTAEVQVEAEEALAEFGFRRRGLLLSTLLVTVLAGALWLKIRSLDSA